MSAVAEMAETAGEPQGVDVWAPALIRARIQSTKEAGDFATEERGKEHGRGWACENADYRELKRLAAERESMDEIEMSEFFTEDFVAASWFYETVNAKKLDDCCHDCFDDFFAKLFGDDAREAVVDAAMIRGFVEGAMEIWNSVKDTI